MVILQVYDRIIPSKAFETLTILMLAMIGVVIVDGALRTLRTLILSWEGATVDHRESKHAVQHVLRMDSLSFERKPAGFYLDRMQALEQIQEFYSSQAVLLIVDFPFVVIFLVLIGVIAGPLLLIPVALLLIFGLASVVSGRRLHKALIDRSTMEDRKQNFIIETLQGIHTIKSMAMESLMLRRYERLQVQSAETVYELSRISNIVRGVGVNLSQAAVVTFVAIGSIFAVQGELTIGALAAGTMLSGRVLQPALRAMGLWTQFQSVRLAKDKLRELFAMKRERSGNYRGPERIRGGIELRDIQFQYDGQKEKLLDGVSLKIAPGEAIGVSGNNGAGKSTLIAVLSGFLPPDQGEMLVDGRPLRDYDLEYLRSQIGIVPQKGILFEGSILENMTLFREGSAIDQAIELSELLGLNEIIARLPDGLDTQVGGAAVDTLSEGVRQNIIMVRSLIGFPSIVLFDDANANFDMNNDRRLLALIERFRGDRTMIMVSHRPSFLRLCNRCYFLSAGKLTEMTDMPSYKNAV